MLHRSSLLALTILSWPGLAAAQECFPECREGYLCHEGECIEACNPPCADGQRCTAEGDCVLAEAEGVPVRDSSLGPGYLAVGFGSDIGEGYGGAFDLEFGGGANGQYFTAIVSTMVGRSWGGSLNVIPSIALGWRGIHGDGPTHFTSFIGPDIGFQVEFDDSYDEVYYYVDPWARAGLGFLVPFQGSGYWGLETSGCVGYRLHLNAAENPWGENYSGFSGMFRVRFRVVF